MLYAGLRKPGTNTTINIGSGSQPSGSRHTRVFNSARTATSIKPAINAMAVRAMITGTENQRSRTVALIQGVAIEISTKPPAIGAQGDPGPLHDAFLQGTFGLHDKAGPAHQHIGHRQRYGDGGCEQGTVPSGSKAADIAPKHPALRHRGEHGEM